MAAENLDELPGKQEQDAARFLIFLAYEGGTLNVKELLFFNFALEDEETGGKPKTRGPSKRNVPVERPGDPFELDALTDERLGSSLSTLQQSVSPCPALVCLSPSLLSLSLSLRLLIHLN